MAGGQHAGAKRLFAHAALAALGGRRPVLAVALYTAALNCLALTGPAYMLLLFDRVLPSGERSELLAATGLMLGLYALGGGIDIARQRLLAGCARRLERRLCGLAARKLSPVPAGELKAVSALLRGQAPAALCDAPLVPLYLVVLALFHPLFAVLAMASAASIAGCVLSIERFCGQGGRGRRRYIGLDASTHKATLTAGVLRALRPAQQSMMLGLGAYLVITGASHPAGIMGAAIILPRLLGPIETIVAHWRTITAGHRGARRLAALLSSPPSSGASEPTAGQAGPSGGVRILLRRSGDYARNASRGCARSASSDLRPTAQ